MENFNRSAFTSSLREIADFIDQNPECPVPYDILSGIILSGKTKVRWLGWAAETSDKDLLRTMAKVFGHADKSTNGSEYVLSGKIGSVDAEVSVSRDSVCRQVKVGTRIVPAREETTIPAVPEHEEDVLEWQCGSILGDEEQQ